MKKSAHLLLKHSHDYLKLCTNIVKKEDIYLLYKRQFWNKITQSKAHFEEEALNYFCNKMYLGMAEIFWDFCV